MSYEEEEDEPEVDPERLRVAHELGEKIGDAARKLGLYQQGLRIGETEEEHPRMVLLVDFLPGDIAWEDRTLNPERHTIDEEFKAIAGDAEDADFEEYRAQLERKLAEGTDDAAPDN